jgi:hypothetical protein
MKHHCLRNKTLQAVTFISNLNSPTHQFHLHAGSSGHKLDKFYKRIHFFINRTQKSPSVVIYILTALPTFTINNSHHPVLTLLYHMSTVNSITALDLIQP